MSQQPTRILVVDDEPNIRAALQITFEIQGYQVLTASSGNEALRLLETENVDVILSDVLMADGDGIELLCAVKRWKRSIRFVLMTGYTDRTSEQALSYGADAFISKPFSQKELAVAIQGNGDIRALG